MIMNSDKPLFNLTYEFISLYVFFPWCLSLSISILNELFIEQIRNKMCKWHMKRKKINENNIQLYLN